eukprot:CAMPEP_0198214580 /NCGR_PEP_ID=MMETSP1445-20131203/42507_1 /TAXON_ID=36898 /ORGANISM="Pyramimonas sp., Strain CCMP2087" /LENGTH=61 /DNA_ID=CAMNT_0043889843 /DNA_START=181 /DNA_END=363 /DNA_ORIENTATION=-
MTLRWRMLTDAEPVRHRLRLICRRTRTAERVAGGEATGIRKRMRGAGGEEPDGGGIQKGDW